MDNNNNSGGKFFNGFLLGMLVGAAVVFLLGTKKGKRLLKAISEEGIDNISDILDRAEKTEDLDEVSTDTPSTSLRAMVDPLSPKASDGHGKSEGQKKNFEKPKVRRFFRGISRRVN